MSEKQRSNPDGSGAPRAEKWGLVLTEPLIFERSRPGRVGSDVTEPTVPASEFLSADMLREPIEGFPEVSEPEVLRHFLRLSQWNLGCATAFYPLGSCTMKYNPATNEEVARLAGFSNLHPLTPDDLSQGALQLLWELQDMLAEVSGMDAVSLQPAAGAHGELTAMKMIRAYHSDRGDPRKTVLIPASAHGTNPASAALCGYGIRQIDGNRVGLIEERTVRQAMDRDVAALL